MLIIHASLAAIAFVAFALRPRSWQSAVTEAVALGSGAVAAAISARRLAPLALGATAVAALALGLGP